METSDKPYMDGVGIIRHTEELNAELYRRVDRLWDALPMAFLSGSAAAVAVLGAGAYLLKASYHEPLALSDYMGALSIAVPVAVVGIWGCLPWVRAGAAVRAQTALVREHSQRMKQETGRRGQGWASS